MQAKRSYYGKRAYEVMKIWTEVYGNDTGSRLKRIIAGKGTEVPDILTAPLWQANNPTEYVPPHTMFDQFAVG